MKILFISLGCDKNLADSEEMLGLLTANGHEIVNTEEEAQAIVINTCCFIHDAKEESVETILEMAEYKKAGTCRALIVTGCMAQRYQEEIIQEIPEVDAVLGTASYGDIVKALNEAAAGNHFQEYSDINRLPEIGSDRVITTGGHYAYLKIAEGCDKHCTYCIIPSLRGNFRSVPEEKLLRQAEYLASQGVKELINAVTAKLQTLPPVKVYESEYVHEVRLPADRSRYEVTKEGDIFYVEADWLEQLLSTVNMDDYSSLQYFQRVLRDTGIIDKLEEMGIEEGQTVDIFGFRFEFIH